MAQVLGTLVSLPEDSNSVPNTHSGCSQLLVTSAEGDLTLSSGFHGYTHVCAHIYKHTHIEIKGVFYWEFPGENLH